MAVQSVWSEVEKTYGIPSGDLKAVIYYRNPKWTHSTVFGARAVGTFVAKPTQSGTTQVTQKNLSSLAVIPEDGIVLDAVTYGLKSGKVLLVSGDPPNAT